MTMRRRVQHLYNGTMLLQASDVLVKDVNTPPHPPTLLMTIRQHVQHLYNAKIQILYPHFGRHDF